MMQFQGFDWLSGQLVHEPLYHAQEKVKSARSTNIIPLTLVRCEMMTTNKALCTSLVIYHLISNACSGIILLKKLVSILFI